MQIESKYSNLDKLEKQFYQLNRMFDQFYTICTVAPKSTNRPILLILLDAWSRNHR